MKKLLLLLPLLLISCKNTNVKKFKVDSYCYSYQTSEIQEYTHDCRLAIFNDTIKQKCFVEVPYDYYEKYINVKYTGKKIWYRVYDINEKCYNNGWELVK